MARVYIGVGSNVDHDHNIREGVKVLKQQFGELVISPVYESTSVGFDSDNFLNLVIGFDTGLELTTLAKALREIEYKFGRSRKEPRFSPRTLDIDILLYDDVITHEGYLQVPRDDIDKYAFVLRPLADIAADMKHPLTGQRYSDLWNAFDQTGQELWHIDIDLD